MDTAEFATLKREFREALPAAEVDDATIERLARRAANICGARTKEPWPPAGFLEIKGGGIIAIPALAAPRDSSSVGVDEWDSITEDFQSPDDMQEVVGLKTYYQGPDIYVALIAVGGEDGIEGYDPVYFLSKELADNYSAAYYGRKENE